jgi:hypothetical protein
MQRRFKDVDARDKPGHDEIETIVVARHQRYR